MCPGAASSHPQSSPSEPGLPSEAGMSLPGLGGRMTAGIELSTQGTGDGASSEPLD